MTAPTAGVIGDVPARVGNQVSPQTVLTTIDQNATLEIQVQVPVERAPNLKRGLPLRVLNADGAGNVAATTVNFISPHVDNQTQSVLVKGTRQQSERDAACVAVCARAHRLEEPPRASSFR